MSSVSVIWRRTRYIFIVSGLLIWATTVIADTQPRIESVSIESEGVAVNGHVAGYESVDYRFSAIRDRHLLVKLITNNPSNYFNILFADDPTAVYVGAVSGNRFEGLLERTGEYTVRVYLMRDAARRDETATYELQISQQGSDLGVSEYGADFADGLTGGPDFWRVEISSGSLNLRAAPAINEKILLHLNNGALLRNIGCRMVDAQRWCNVEAVDSVHQGWVAGQYLREGIPPE